MLAQHDSIPNPLGDKYYLDNFNYLAGFVEQHYHHLLNDEEKEFIGNYKKLPVNAQQVYVRVACRSAPYLRVTKLNYPEIQDIPGGIDQLCAEDFLSRDINYTDEQCLALFTQAEKKNALSIAGLQTPATITDTNLWAAPDLFGQSPVSKLLANEQLIEVRHKQHILTFRMLFFGNLYQDFSSFVLRDLGVKRYESYRIDNSTLLFQNREQLQAHLAYYDCTELFDSALESGSEALLLLHQQLPQTKTDDKTLARRLDKLKNKLARQLEREQELDAAAQIYTCTVRPPARERLARIYAKQGNDETALTLCQEIIDSPRDIDEFDFANSFGTRLAKKTKTIFSATTEYSPPDIHLSLTRQALSVEFTVALHLAKTGKCYYMENNLLNSVFGLALWDIIFAPVKGVFFHPFQIQPTDFYEPEFIHHRKELINKRLDAVKNGDLQHFVFKHHFEKHGILNPLVNWHIAREHIISLALKRIPPDDWHAMLTHFLKDIRNFRSGQPDLFYFPNEGGYELIEVKAPGDRLQKNQLRWMRFFEQQNMTHCVANVEWLDD